MWRLYIGEEKLDARRAFGVRRVLVIPLQSSTATCPNVVGAALPLLEHCARRALP